ncbi:MAG: O-antigen ligase family protein [Sphingobacteriales bacterium]|nr:O-antigen ligase family protein [Sphingobacteriales bacterium]
MERKLQHSRRSNIIFILMIAMLAGLFFSRALLSIAMAAFIALSFFHTNIRSHFRNFFSSPLLWGVSLLFFLPLLSGLWSGDKQQWGEIMIIKLPLFLLPLAFAGPINFSKTQWNRLAYVFLLLITGGTIWSMFQYVPDAAVINADYFKAKSIITPLQNDHVRFSWLVSMAVLLSLWLGWSARKENKKLSWILIIAAAWLVIFLHLLAARTGLISFYIMLAGSIIWLLIKRVKPVYSITLFTLLLALPFVAYKTLPSFHNRVKYFLYEFEYLKKTHYLPGANDAVRVISIKAGWNIMKKHPVTGVGFGNVIGETREWYGENYPQMIESDKILPASEWMMYGAGCGVPGLLIFSLAILIPFFAKTKNKLLWYLLNSTAAFSFLFDIGLEVQFGVFIYSFTVLWFYKWLHPEKL